jgi:hypothetical protein
MIEVVIMDKQPNEVMDIVRELRAQGLVQGQDFDFAYRPATYDNFSGDAVHNRYTSFNFYSEKYATLFALKYSK